MFSKILVANRGEIAVRIIRALKDLGIGSVAVYSEADAAGFHLRLADERICVGPAVSAKSYLNVERIIQAAKETGAEAVHPGYGYLAESEGFAEACETEGLVFVGPTRQNLKLAGDKLMAKNVVREAGVPIIPSSSGPIPTLQEALPWAMDMGYPVMIKASGGGGGRGIRICDKEETLQEEFPIAKMEAQAAFGNDHLYLEKYVARPRHIEFQVLADRAGNVIHLGERECTIQRRYQKLIEESPSPGISSELRAHMGAAAVTAARAMGYVNAGTVEFLVDKDQKFYFMEINARIQVEHPVTEMVTGLDLIKEQIRLASGENLGYTSDEVRPRGCAMECRINAEDPDKGFLPSPGVAEAYHAPSGFGVRVDSHLYPGYEMPVFYDSLIAKLICHDLTRKGVIGIMKRALKEFTIRPLKTTIPLYLKIMDDPAFGHGDFDTGYIQRFIPDPAGDP
jgi:acetyl-CoA carboxylase biotin carboxylase subunit